MAGALRKPWLESNYPNLTRVENVNHLRKTLPWSVILKLPQKHESMTFTIESCKETFKIQKGPLNCESEKVLQLLKDEVCGEAPLVGKGNFH